ncbi:MAG TPA: IS1595 family transposase [Flavobacteriaceae bacterium]|nr:IS1595 family transposase [Bacteroidota bacterium]HPF11163.1 IS1595 family transposase [Flavobacteriaceae bacterium]HRW43718.1 IS1595 family transposase [Flavobacteriaceae bacterium]
MIPEDFKGYFIDSSPSEQQEMISELLSLLHDSGASLYGEKDRVLHCPHCGSGDLRGNGRLKGVQRYVCKGCGKNFSETTGKFWYNIKKKDKVRKYLFCMLSGYTIRKSARETGISIQTSFDWRHKLLMAFSEVSPQGFRGIVESDELFFPYSEKGSRGLCRTARKRGGGSAIAGSKDGQVAVVATCDRSGNIDFKVATRGRISRKDIEMALNGRLDSAEVLSSDAHRSYGAFARENKIPHKRANAKMGQRIVEKVYHIQNVNAMDSRLRKFMQGFNGVSTKYLQNYLNWFMVLDKIRYSTKKMAFVIAITLASQRAWFEYKNEMFNMLFRT